jgi:hypoxanthine phosphoribosyltransferase
VLSIARGGVFVAGGLAYALDCKNIHLVNVEYTSLTASRIVVNISKCAGESVCTAT